MKQQAAPESLIITCSCSRLDHAVRFTCYQFDGTGPFEAYIEVSLDYERSWWGRLMVALRYLFKRTCGYGHASEILVHDDDLPKIRAWLDHAEATSRGRGAPLQ